MLNTLFIDNFRGIRKFNPVADLLSSGVVSALNCQNVELTNTEHSKNLAIFTAKGNKAVKDIGQKVVGQFESIQNGTSYWFIYATDDTRGYLYTLGTDNELTLLDVNLSVSDDCNGITIAQGYNDWFVFTNGVDDYLGVCMSQAAPEDRIKFLNATDAEGRDIRGLGLEVQDGRLVTFCQNRVHWSGQSNIFDWISSDEELLTAPAYQEFDRDVTAIILYNDMLIAFTDEYSTYFKGNPGDASTFTRGGASGGGCPSFRSVIKFDNKLFYYDNKAKNVFAYYLMDSGQTRPSEGLANNVISYFEEIDESKLNKIEMVSYIHGNKSEIWLKFPSTERNVILIYDYLNGEWCERVAQADIHGLSLIKGGLYSLSGTKVLKEYVGSTFDGEYIPSEYKTNIINLQSDSNIKVPKMPLILTLDFDCENDFYMEFIYDDMPKKSRTFHIVKMMKGYLIWANSAADEKGGLWSLDASDENGGMWVSSDKNTVMFNLAGVLPFKQLQIRIFTKDSPQEFAVKRLEFKRVGLKTKSLG